MGRIIKLLDTTFTDNTLPVLQRDVLINAGTKFLFDFKSAYCFPKQAAPVAGDTLLNLVQGQPGATVTAGSGFTYGGGGIYMPGAGSRIDLGNTYAMAASNPFWVGIWIKLPTAYNSVDQYQAIFSRGANTGANGTQYFIDANANGLKLRGSIAGASFGAATTDVGQDLSLNVVYHVALAFENNLVKVFLNGVLKGSIAFAPPIANLTANTVIAGGNWKGTVYRVICEDLALSGKTAAGQIQAEYTANVSRFS